MPTNPNKLVYGPLNRSNITEINVPTTETTITAYDGNVSISFYFNSDVGHTENARWVVRVSNTSAP